MAFHPAATLLSWVMLVAALQFLSVQGLSWAALALLPFPLIFARQRAFVLLRRTRWLLLSIAVMFVLATPGERLSGVAGDLGITYDGLLLAAEHLLRLTLLLATLALLHERIGTSGMMSGIHWLLAPLAGWKALREKIVVRLMLVLDYVEDTPPTNWRTWLSIDGPATDQRSAHVELVVAAARAADWAVMGLLAVLALAFGWAA